MGEEDRSSNRRISQLEQTIRRHMPAPAPGVTLPILGNRTDRLLRVLEAMNAWVCEFDGKGRSIYASPQVEAILGFSPKEILSPGATSFHPDDIPAVIAAGRKLRETGKPSRSEVRVRHKDGHWVWVETSLIAWSPSEAGDFHTVGIVRDITARKSAEAARLESEERYGVVTQMSCDLILEVNRQGKLTWVGPGAEEIVGFSFDEATAFEPFERVHPEDVGRVREQLAQAFEEESKAGEGEIRQERKPQLMEYRAQHDDGRWLWFETLGLTYRRADGDVRFLAVGRDVTDRKRAEEKRRELEERMQQAQKLESLGVLAGGIAHDFNNLLTPILGAAGLGLTELPEDSPVRARLQTIQQATRRAAALTSQMLAYAGQRPLCVERLDLTTLVGEMRALAASSISGKTILDLDLESQLPAIEGEAAQLSQVVMNLISNAAEALEDGAGRITLRTGVTDLEAAPAGALFAETMTTGQHVYFEVTDTGSGMDDATCGRIFDPFFTTKFTGRGLGLAAVAGIVRGHHGAIEVDSEPGRGTRFRVLLPAIADPVEQPEVVSSLIENWRSTGTALVIDDDAGVRELAEDVLRRAGMKVLTACDGYEGAKLFGLHADSIRIVLLDRTMPSMSGADTFEAIRELRPNAKILLVSGYPQERVAAELGDGGSADFLQKPFLPNTLLERVRALLELPAKG